MGKGSGPREGIYERPIPGAPKHGIFDNRTPQEKFEDNWERIFGAKKRKESEKGER